jgi:hypothetical protein
MNVLIGRLSRFQHLSDETISRLIAGELTTVRGFSARSHIEKCWQCRSRREAFERAAMQVTEHRNRLVKGTPPNLQRRELLLANLRRRAEQTAPQPIWTRSISNFRMWTGNQMSPIFTSTAIVLTAAALLIWVWQRSVINPVSAAQLLQRAVTSDTAISQEKTGVVYQKVRITTSRLKVEHEVYRDPRGIRRRRPEPAKTETEPIQQVLSTIGVEWDAPLSAASYREWHDRQTSVSDEVRKEDGNLLTLVSKVPNNWIEEESLTVRASDFHPISRTIETRSYGTIEIAELSYAVLPWSGVNEALFEPLGVPIHANPVILPSLPTAAELDSAELSARLVLNQLHADEGEQINVTRTDHTVEVKGVVETDERKREIVQKLWPLQHVKADVLSIAELQSLPRDKPTAQSVKMQSVDVQPSPLAKYLDVQGARKTELADASQRLLDAALKVRQNTSELTTLQKRFSTLDESGPRDSVFTQLTQSYSERLTAGLDAEAATLGALGFEDRPRPSSDAASLDLSAEVDRNDALCRELIAGSPETVRPASEIVPEVYESIARIRSAVAAPSQVHQIKKSTSQP